MENLKELWADPSLAKIIYETINEWEENEQINDILEEEIMINEEEEENEENEKRVYWNSLPKELKLLLQKKFLEPFEEETLNKEKLLKIFVNVGFTEEFVNYYIKENISGKEINQNDLKYHLGTIISCSHEILKSKTNE